MESADGGQTTGICKRILIYPFSKTIPGFHDPENDTF